MLRVGWVVPVIDRVLEHYFRWRPVNATFTGVHAYDDRLPDWSPDGLEALAHEMRRLRRELGGVRPPSSGAGDTASEVSRADLALARGFLDIQLDEVSGDHFYRRNPALYTGEALFAIIGLVTRPFAPFDVRVAHLRARLDALPAFLAGARRTLTTPIPGLWRARALRECRAAETLLGEGIPRWLARHGASWHGNDGCPLFADFARWLEEEAPRAETDTLGCGPEMFDALLRHGHWVAVAPDELARQAEAALADARATLDRQAREADDGGWPGVQKRLADHHPTRDGYLDAFARAWDDCRRAAEDAALVTWPDAPLRYMPIPDHTRDVAPHLYYLFYRSPAPRDRLDVHEAVVPPVEADLPLEEQERRLRASNYSVIRLNHVIHHGALGHHVQNAVAARSASRIGQIAAVDCASRIGMFCGGTMAEGWACYAVDLMEEIGFLTPLERVAQQHTRVRLLARALLDLGLHRSGWTGRQALRFWQETVGASWEAAAAEVTRTSMFPGTAIMYWLGTSGLHDLRADVSRAAGADFSLCAFHDRVLGHGSIPVPLVASLLTGKEMHP